jgi:hypothetical protein
MKKVPDQIIHEWDVTHQSKAYHHHCVYAYSKEDDWLWEPMFVVSGGKTVEGSLELVEDHLKKQEYNKDRLIKVEVYGKVYQLWENNLKVWDINES